MLISMRIPLAASHWLAAAPAPNGVLVNPGAPSWCRRILPDGQGMLLDEHVKWTPWVWGQLVGLWESIASLWAEEEEPPPESLTAAQRGPPPASLSCGNVVITGNVCVSPRPYESLCAKAMSRTPVEAVAAPATLQE